MKQGKKRKRNGRESPKLKDLRKLSTKKKFSKKNKLKTPCPKHLFYIFLFFAKKRENSIMFEMHVLAEFFSHFLDVY